MYSVPVKSENWKLNLLMNLICSEEFGNGGKTRGFEV